MILNFVLLGGLSFILSVAFTLVVKKVAARFGFMDKPDSDRKIHLRPTPLLGGTAIFLSFWAVTAYLMFSHPSLYGINIFSKKLKLGKVFPFSNLAILDCFVPILSANFF